MLVAVNIAAIGALGWLGARFALDGGRHALVGLLVPGYFGLITSLSRDTAEPLAAALLLAGLLAVRARRPGLAACFLAYGALTRETVMVAVATIAILRVIGVLRGRVRPGRDDLTWVIPAVVFTAWEAVVKLATGSIPLLADGGRNAGAPFIAPPPGVPAQPRPHPPARLSSSTTCGSWNWSSWWPFVVAALLSLAVHQCAPARAAGLRPVPGRDLRGHAEHLEQPRHRHAVVHRGVPAGGDHPAGHAAGGRARLAWQLSSMTALMIPALIFIVQRRLTGS